MLDAVILVLCVLAACSAEHIPALLAFTAAAGLLTIGKEIDMGNLVDKAVELFCRLDEATQEACLERLSKKVAERAAARALASQAES